MRVWGIGTGLMVLVACSSEAEPFKACKIGELTGTWRIRYLEDNGTCGPLADETVVLTPGMPDPAAAKCMSRVFQIAPDKCAVDQDFTCPTSENKGTQRWIGSLRQNAERAMGGSYTVQINDPRVTCRSTYSVQWTQQ